MMTLTESCMADFGGLPVEASTPARTHQSPSELQREGCANEQPARPRIALDRCKTIKIHSEKDNYQELVLFEIALLAEHFVLHGTQEQPPRCSRHFAMTCNPYSTSNRARLCSSATAHDRRRQQFNSV